jgi:hypothetical protein
VEFIDEIQSAVASGTAEELENGPELAAHYARFCANVDLRLKRVLSLLADGRTIEALIEEEQSPALAEECALLCFDGVEAWRETCAGRGWSVANALDAKAIARLREALQVAQQPSELISAYRVAAREKNIQRCIWLLRRLEQAETGNGRHGHDLREFEQRRLQDMRTEVEYARETVDELAIRKIAAELKSQGWAVKIPLDLKSTVDAEISRIDGAAALKEAAELIDHLGRVYSAMDVESGINLVGNIDAILKESGIELPRDLAVQYAEARDWCGEEEHRRRDEAEFSRKLSDLGSAVEISDARSADALLNELARHDRPIPESLATRASTLVENWELSCERARRRTNTIIVAMLIVVCLSGLLVWRNIQSRHRAGAIAKQLDGMIEQLNLESYENMIRRIGGEEPSMLKHPLLIPHLGKSAEISHRIDGKRVRFDAVISRLQEALSSTNTPGDLASLIVDAEALAHNVEELVTVTALSEAWADRQSEIQHALQDNLDLWSLKMEEAVSQLEMLDPRAQRDELAGQLEEVKRLLEASPTKAGMDVENILARYAARIEDVETTQKDLESQLESIQTAGSISEYLDALDLFARVFPNDKRAVEIQSVLDKRRLYESLLEPFSSARESNPFWGPLVERETTMSASDTSRWLEVRDRIVEWEHDDRLVNLSLLRIPGATSSHRERRIYVQGPATPKNTTHVELMIYEPLPGSRDSTPNFKITPVPRRLARTATKLEHCAVIDRFVAELRFTKEEEAFETLIVHTIQLLQDAQVPALLRVDLGSDLIEIIREISSDSASSLLENADDKLRNVGDMNHWLCIGHPQYEVASKKANESLSDVCSNLRRLQKSGDWKHVDRVARQRAPYWIACADLDAQKVYGKSNIKNQEFWIVRRDGSTPRILIYRTLSKDGKQNHLAKLKPGEPLFAPRNGITTRVAIDNLRRRGISISTSEIIQDPAWPSNHTE